MDLAARPKPSKQKKYLCLGSHNFVSLFDGVRNCLSRLFSLPFFLWSNRPTRAKPPHCRGFKITYRHNALGRTSVDEGPARRRDLYLHNTQHSQETNIHTLAGFEPAIPESERPQAYALGRAATGIGK